MLHGDDDGDDLDRRLAVRDRCEVVLGETFSSPLPTLVLRESLTLSGFDAQGGDDERRPRVGSNRCRDCGAAAVPDRFP